MMTYEDNKPLENIDKTVFEKYDDYKYPFSKHG